jgi:hypothetical protein
MVMNYASGGQRDSSLCNPDIGLRMKAGVAEPFREADLKACGASTLRDISISAHSINGFAKGPVPLPAGGKQ